jgi:hypothetical protein
MTLAELSRLRSRVEHEYSSKRAIWRRPSIYWPARPTRPERQARSSRRSNIGSADVRRAKAPPSSAATLAHRGTRHRRVDRDRRRDCGRACPAGRAGGTRGTPEDRLDEIASGIREQATTSGDNLPPQHFSDTAFEHLGVRRRPPRLPSLARKPRRHAPAFAHVRALDSWSAACLLWTSTRRACRDRRRRRFRRGKQQPCASGANRV